MSARCLLLSGTLSLTFTLVNSSVTPIMAESIEGTRTYQIIIPLQSDIHWRNVSVICNACT